MSGLLRRLLGGGAGGRHVTGDTLDVAEAARRVAAGELLLVDVREAAEWRGGRPAGARHVPLSQLGATLDELGAGPLPVAFICQSGRRSGAACATARRSGLGAANVRGGFLAWQRAGLPVARG